MTDLLVCMSCHASKFTLACTGIATILDASAQFPMTSRSRSLAHMAAGATATSTAPSLALLIWPCSDHHHLSKVRLPSEQGVAHRKCSMRSSSQDPYLSVHPSILLPLESSSEKCQIVASVGVRQCQSNLCPTHPALRLCVAPATPKHPSIFHSLFYTYAR